MTQTIWQIGRKDGPSPDFPDNYKTPLDFGDVTWTVGASENVWPLYQPSEADPEANYLPHPRRVVFELPRVDAVAYELIIDYLIIAPRVPHLKLNLNGQEGEVYLRPRASTSGEIRLLSGLHTTLYADGHARVTLPAALLREGTNELTLTAVDAGDVLMVHHPERIKRLDRMANGAGIIYQYLALRSLDEQPAPRLTIDSSVLYRRHGGQLQNRVDIVLHGPDRDELNLRLSGEPFALGARRLPFGDSRFSVWIPDGPADIPYDARHGASAWSGTLTRKRKWTVYVAAHSHVDIGYTHRQEEVAERHNRNLDTAIHFLETGHPNFTYHLDCSWPLEDYLKTRSAPQLHQLRHWVKAGRINIVSGYADVLTQFAALEDLIRNAHFSDDFLRPLARRAELAAVVDVASITASYPDLLAGAGVKYLVHANNQDRGPFRVNGNLHRQSPFWWEGQAGGRVLTWLAKMYCELRKVCGSPPTLSSAERGLSVWLAEYDRADYAPDCVLLYGQEADNTDLDPQPNEFIEQWNSSYAYPRLVAADPREFFAQVERFADQLPTLRGDGGAYWEDGALTSLQETLLAREAQARLPAAETLGTLAAIHDPKLRADEGQLQDAWRDLLLYDEHTWGAFLSVSDPNSQLAHDQWDVKASCARRVRLAARQALHAAACRHSLQWNTAGREVVVFNPHNWEVSASCHAEVARGEAPHDPRTGEQLPYRVVNEHATQRLLAFQATVPGLSYRRFPLKFSPERPPGVSREVTEHATVQLRSPHYRLIFDLKLGRITSLTDLDGDHELLGEGGAGALVYVRGGEGSRILSNQADLPLAQLEQDEQFDLLYAELVQDALGETLRLHATVPQGQLQLSVHLSAHHKRLDLAYTYDKQATSAREAAYVRFDLNVPDARVLSDSQLGWVDWNANRLPGACVEWLPLQSGVLLDSARTKVFIASPDVPLFTSGDIVRGTWPKSKVIRGGRIYSYLLNNYWHTNYQARQGGALHFRYSLTSDATLPRQDASRVGREARLGLYTQRISYQDFREAHAPYGDPHGGCLAQVSDNVALSVLKPARDGRGVILRVQDLQGERQQASVQFMGRHITEVAQCDLLEYDLSLLKADAERVEFSVPAWGLATIRVVFAPGESQGAGHG
ncbi:glycosyl hydrolase-related protein [Deinococcus peraridilitoris]|uniref:Alpha-mannosidase n=1 Tax=Deinococcus peraridilitoris (strain DSM 19664 / LMG 22246 / CIP 109416 / KR-200) TaxID=937777 RepID=K9ZVL7_DEIPD|nr:glycosyl hydrolase-related protein [Deinococcus peraridilitoris]AFZ65643.1 alpha-mannosidase [Deinococcus peraridilitoris DSM 19664]